MNQHRGHPGLIILFGLIAFVAVILVFFALAYYFAPAPLHGYYFFWPVFPFGFVIFFLALFLIFGVFRWAFWSWGWRRGGYGGYYADPKQILKRRYARGEITKEQFDQMMRDLDEHA